MSDDAKLNILNALRWTGAYILAAALGGLVLGLSVLFLINADLPIISNGVLATGNDFGRAVLGLSANPFLMLLKAMGLTIVLVLPAALFLFALGEVMGLKARRGAYSVVGACIGLISYAMFERPSDWATLSNTLEYGWTSYVPAAWAGLILGSALALLRRSWLRPLRELPL